MISTSRCALALLCLGAATSALAASDHERCLLEQLARADDRATVAQLRAACAAPATPADAVVSRRLQEEAETVVSQRYALLPHRPNFLLPLTYSLHRPGNESFRRDIDDEGTPAQKIEGKFQISFKVPLVFGVAGSRADLYAGYTQRSFWQMYNAAASKPFRESNYEPELWAQWPIGREIAGWNLVAASTGWVHQSNGRGQEFSRSWDRLFASAILERGEWAMLIRPWWRLPEDPNNDDNPDISHYMGSFDVALGRKWGAHSFDMQLRNNLHARRNKGAVQLGWSFPLPRTPRLRGYAQLFHGYGENLLDYNVRTTSVGLGVMLADW